MAKILVTPVKSKYCSTEPFVREGNITRKYFEGDCWYYYVGTLDSYPEEIVTILEGEVKTVIDKCCENRSTDYVTQFGKVGA